ncbi:MAG: efflux RND transporter periplasmic adaptor subunit [Betaproteobacteria bacterium]|nr:efflux RND transporter periplasmic adaptor subunit [Betaproteobacteria bacterium]
MRALPVLLVTSLLGMAMAVAQDLPVWSAKPLAEVAVYPERDASAQVVSLNASRIAAEIAGRIEELPVEVGQRVAKGALVARLDCRDHELAHERAQAALAAARARWALAGQQLDRARDLRAQGFVSEEALAARRTETEVLRAEVAQADVQLATSARAVGKCVVRAPFAAIVRERLGQVGELAAPGAPLAVLVDVSRIEVVAQVQAKDAASLKHAAKLRFLGPGGARQLALARISPDIDPQTRVMDARLRFAGPAAATGESGRVVWRDSEPHIAPELVVRRAGRLGVFLEDAGVARFHVLPEAQEGRPARADLPPGARVVVTGQLALKDGQRLR